MSNVETVEHCWVLGEKAERSWLLQGRSGQLTQPQRSNLSPMIYILRLWIIASRDGANKLQSQDERELTDEQTNGSKKNFTLVFYPHIYLDSSRVSYSR